MSATSRRRLNKCHALISFSIDISLIFGAALSVGAPLQAQAANKLLIQTKEGPVSGFICGPGADPSRRCTVGGVAGFLGIPYAAPPIGNLRWMPTKPHAPWTKTLKATAFGPNCAQITTLGVFAGPANDNEDCLYLNVFAPNLDPAAKERLPVIVWIHGGGNIDGESNDYDGSKLAAQGHTVVVTINYRLGLLGWLAHPALDAEGHPFGDYGTLDQQAALKWVKRNIAQFGGDKDNVTLGGQSEGSIHTAINVVSPLAAGLFHRAILESGVNAPTSLASAEAVGVAFASAAGCSSGTAITVAKCLRGLSVAKIMALQGTTSAGGPFASPPIVEGKILPSSYTSAFASGDFNHMPVMSGTAHDEYNFFNAINEYFSGPPRVPVSNADFENYITDTYSSSAYPAGTVDKVRARYPLYAYPTAQLALNAVGTDGAKWNACAQLTLNRLLANHVPVYAYEFNDQTAPNYFPKMPGYTPLAYHTADIQYLFPLYHGGPLGISHPLNAKQEELSDQLVAAWTNFAWTGNPNGQGNSPWPAFKNTPGKSGYYLSEDIPILSTMTEKQFSDEHKCDFWSKIQTY